MLGKDGIKSFITVTIHSCLDNNHSFIYRNKKCCAKFEFWRFLASFCVLSKIKDYPTSLTERSAQTCAYLINKTPASQIHAAPRTPQLVGFFHLVPRVITDDIPNHCLFTDLTTQVHYPTVHFKHSGTTILSLMDANGFGTGPSEYLKDIYGYARGQKALIQTHTQLAIYSSFIILLNPYPDSTFTGITPDRVAFWAFFQSSITVLPCSLLFPKPGSNLTKHNVLLKQVKCFR